MANRELPAESVEGELGIIIRYKPGESEAITVLKGAMQLIGSLEQLDKSLLSSVNSSLEPVSILNDIEHSSLKLLLIRTLKNIPDDTLASSLDWKMWAGKLLVLGRHKLLSAMPDPDEVDDNDNPVLDMKKVEQVLNALNDEYKKAPQQTAGYLPPSTDSVRGALKKVGAARAMLPDGDVIVQSELGDIKIPFSPQFCTPEALALQTTNDSLVKRILVIETVAFKKDNVWRFSDGENTFTARINDATFLSLIENGEPFSKGDKLNVTMCETQTEVDETLSIKRVIEHVHEHIKRPTQRKLLP